MRVERSPGAVTEVVGERSLVVDPDGRKVVTLSPTGSVVWESIDGTRDLAALAEILVARTTVPSLEQAEADVAAFVDQLLAAGLVRRSDAPS